MAGTKNTKWMLLGGVAAGAAAFYFLDRERGAERRTRFAAGARRAASELSDTASDTARDTWHRLTGISRQLWNTVNRELPGDEILVERIRSHMGRIVRHPHKIHVASDNGVVTLWGPASESEIRKLAHHVENMPGVRQVMNHLEPHEEIEPAAQEPSLYRKARRETLLNWSPAKRLIAGAAGTAAVLYGLRRNDRAGASLALVGAGLAAASASRKNVHSVLAFSEDSPGFELEKTIRINAPVSDVYDFWSNPLNYPKVFGHVSAIEQVGENLYRWTLVGPAGIPVHWEGAITRKVPNTLVEWKSLPGSTVANLGFVRVDPNYDASTRVLVRMFYRPPAGILGRFLAEIFGADPRKVLEQDLKHLKHIFEKDEDFIRQIRDGEDKLLLRTATT
jgi:uncharacterized membrane protein